MKKDWQAILKRKNLFNEIVETELNKKIEGEINARKVLFLCSSGRLVENCQIASYNLLINDDPGAGKDHIAKTTLKVLPGDAYHKRSRISETALTYWHNAEKEPTWSWNGKVLYLEDISDNVLNSSVFKVFTSEGSYATITINNDSKDIEIKGKPVCIVTSASAIPNPEILRRFPILNLTSSQKQTKAVMAKHSRFAKTGIIPKLNPKYSNALQLLQRVKVKIPFAEKLHDHFPSKNIIMRTNYPRFLDYIKASAAFHQYQRKKDVKGFIIAEEQDYELARICFLKLYSNPDMIPLTLNQRKILERFCKDPIVVRGNVTQLHAQYMNFLSDRALATNLNILAGYGFVESIPELNEHNREMQVWQLAGEYKPGEALELPNYAQICRITSTSSTPNSSSTSSTTSISKKNTILYEKKEIPKKWKHPKQFSAPLNVAELREIDQVNKEFTENE